MASSNTVAVGKILDMIIRCKSFRGTNRGNSNHGKDTHKIKDKHSGVRLKMMKRMKIQSGLTSTPRKRLATFSDVKSLMRKRPGQISKLSKTDSNRTKR